MFLNAVSVFSFSMISCLREIFFVLNRDEAKVSYLKKGVARMNFNRKLVLADGTVFPGNGFGSPEEVVCEVIFNTGMTGYQEVLTDPAYYNQMVVMTYPMIGNYGINNDDYESHGASALIVKEYCEVPSNWRSVKSLDEFLKERNTPGLCDVDTRALTIKIREEGIVRGIIVDADVSDEDAIAKLNAAPIIKDHVKQVSPKELYKVPALNKKFRVVFMAFGATEGMINELVKRHCEVIVVPYHATFEDIDALSPDGVVLSNGPGNPEDISEVLPTIRELQVKYPLFGVSLGHQLLALANGATVSKMKFGHHGGNIPVKDIASGRTLITFQNHDYAIDANSLTATDLELTHYAINDDTVQGVKHTKYPAFAVQFLPEVHVGPQDSEYLFDQFIESLGAN